MICGGFVATCKTGMHSYRINMKEGKGFDPLPSLFSSVLFSNSPHFHNRYLRCQSV